MEAVGGGYESDVFFVPSEVLTQYVKNKKEMQFILQISNTFDCFILASDWFTKTLHWMLALRASDSNPLLVNLHAITSDSICALQPRLLILKQIISSCVQEFIFAFEKMDNYVEANENFAHECLARNLKEIAEEKLILAKMERELKSRIDVFIIQPARSVSLSLFDFRSVYQKYLEKRPNDNLVKRWEVLIPQIKKQLSEEKKESDGSTSQSLKRAETDESLQWPSKRVRTENSSTSEPHNSNSALNELSIPNSTSLENKTPTDISNDNHDRNGNGNNNTNESSSGSSTSSRTSSSSSSLVIHTLSQSPRNQNSNSGGSASSPASPPSSPTNYVRHVTMSAPFLFKPRLFSSPSKPFLDHNSNQHQNVINVPPPPFYTSNQPTTPSLFSPSKDEQQNKNGSEEKSNPNLQTPPLFSTEKPLKPHQKVNETPYAFLGLRLYFCSPFP